MSGMPDLICQAGGTTRRLLFSTLILLSLTGVLPVRQLHSSEPLLLEARIIHTPMTALRPDQKFVVQARVDGATRQVSFMRIYYKTQHELSFSYLEMTRAGAGFIGELPESEIASGEMQYFILALVGASDATTYPAENPYGNPLTVSVAPGRARSARTTVPPASVPVAPPTVQPTPTRNINDAPPEEFASPTDLSDLGPLLVLSPEDGETFGEGEEVLIAVSFMPSDDDAVDPASISLLVDGQNVTGNAEVTENVLTYSTLELGPGAHQIHVQGHFQSGAELPGQAWNFIVKGKAKRLSGTPAFRGRVFAESRHENISDVSFDDNNIGGNVSGQAGFAKYNARVFLTSREDNQFQPRHRFTARVDLPLVGFTVGDTYPRFNDLMLWGKRVRGVHGRLRLGFFNADVITGQTVRKVHSALALVKDSLADSTFKTVTGADSTQLTGATHSQNLLGLRASFGSGKNFQLGFNVLKVRDDTTSVGTSRGDTLFTLPQDNLVVGSDFLLAFANHRIEFRAGGAISWLSTDITGGPANLDSLESQFDVEVPDFLDPEKLKYWLIFNSSTTPIDPRDLTSVAYNASFRFNMLNNNLEVGYKSIGSQYNSQGNSFLRNNLRGFYVQDRFRLWQNKLYLNLGLENYDDNFDADDQNKPTALRTVTTGFSVFPGAGLPTVSFNLRNYNRDNDLTSVTFDTLNFDPTNPAAATIDTLDNRENNTTRDLSVQLSYDTRFLNLNNSISLSLITSGRDDKFVPITENSSNVQVLSVRSTYPFPLVTTVNFAHNNNQFGDGLNDFKFSMFGAKAEYGFWRNRLNTYVGTNITSASGVSLSDTSGTALKTVTDYSRFAFNTGARFEISPGHFVLLDGSIIRFNDNGSTTDQSTTISTTNPSFTDRIFRLYYEKRF